MFKKLLPVFIFVFLIFTSARGVLAGPYEDCLAQPNNTPTECRAATGYYNQNVQNVVVIDPRQFETDSQNTITTGQITALPYFGGTILGATINGLRCYIDDSCNVPQTSTNGRPQVNRGAIGTMAMAIGGLYENKPASTVDYINDMAMKAGFPQPIKPVYAANGIGFTSLKPVMALWQLIRNIAYLIFSVIFVVIGLMILLRVKIDPKTVINIQNALPRIVWSLILITFSYPLAGFLIDMMYVLIGVIISAVSLAGILPPDQIQQFSTNLTTESIFGVVGAGNWLLASGAGGYAVKNVVDSLLGPLSLGGTVGSIVGALGGLIIAVAILYALVRTWLALLGAYINILVGVILSPLAMLSEAIPGVGGFSMWIRSMLANLLAFPLVITIMLFGSIIMAYGTAGQFGGQEAGFVPPLIGGNNPSAITALIGLGILLMIPKATAMLQDFLKSPPFKYGMAWQESMGWAGGQTAGRAYGWGYDRYVGTPEQRYAAYQAEHDKWIMGGSIGPEPVPPAERANWVARNLLPKKIG